MAAKSTCVAANEKRVLCKGADECRRGVKVRKALKATMGCDECKEGVGWYRCTVRKDVHHESRDHVSLEKGGKGVYIQGAKNVLCVGGGAGDVRWETLERDASARQSALRCDSAFGFDVVDL